MKNVTCGTADFNNKRTLPLGAILTAEDNFSAGKPSGHRERVTMKNPFTFS